MNSVFPVNSSTHGPLNSEAARRSGAKIKLSLGFEGTDMVREETPIWIKRRIQRRMAKGRDAEAAIRVLAKKSRTQHADESDPTPRDNVIPFPGVTYPCMTESRTA